MREFASRYYMVEALANDIRRAGDEASPREIAAHLVEVGWRPGGDS